MDSLGLRTKIQIFFIFFFKDRCEATLGMQDGTIFNSRLTASSMYNQNHGPWRARLWKRNRGGSGAWCAKYNNNHQWIQVIGSVLLI